MDLDEMAKRQPLPTYISNDMKRDIVRLSVAGLKDGEVVYGYRVDIATGELTEKKCKASFKDGEWVFADGWE